jgi:hypothetical protein
MFASTGMPSTARATVAGRAAEGGRGFACVRSRLGLEYPACVLSPEWWRQAAAIVDLMEQFYQKVGEVCADEGVTSE